MAADPTKIEFLLNESDFNELDFANGTHALAINIQTLLLTEPGSMPNDPEMGVGIQHYIMEILDEVLINGLRKTIMDQLNKYIPTQRTINVSIQTIQDKNTYTGVEKGLAILIAVEPPEGISDIEDLVKIGFMFGQGTTGKLISHIIV